jgi:hypothetical protein
MGAQWVGRGQVSWAGRGIAVEIKHCSSPGAQSSLPARARLAARPHASQRRARVPADARACPLPSLPSIYPHALRLGPGVFRKVEG